MAEKQAQLAGMAPNMKALEQFDEVTRMPAPSYMHPPYSRDADPHDATSLLYLRAQVQGRLASMEGEFDSARTNQKTMAQRFNALQARPLFLCRAVVVTVLRPLA